MGATFSYQRNKKLEAELKLLLKGARILVGPATRKGSELAKYVAANEFGAEIKPKNGRYLAIPLNREAKEGSPRDFDLTFIPGSKGKSPILAKVEKNSVTPYYLLKDSITIPERAPIRSAIRKKETLQKAKLIFRDRAQKVISGQGTAQQAFDALGLSFVASIKQNIRSNIGPTNSSLTIALKRSRGTTLVDEGRFLHSVQHEVRNA